LKGICTIFSAMKRIANKTLKTMISLHMVQRSCSETCCR